MRTLLPLVALALAGCEPQPDAADFRPVDPAIGPGAAAEAWEDADQNARREVFYFGGEERSEFADYLFVIDNSISMQAVLDRFHGGFAKLARDPKAFPSKARIGVTNMVPAHLSKPDAPHPSVKHKGITRVDPGFQQLVSQQGIARYRTVAVDAPRFAPFDMDGCDPWFAPDATNEAGTPCVVAHTQISLAVVNAEAGLTAFQQLLDKQGGKPLFRTGAAANVIFVSDTHDPGLPGDGRLAQQLVEARPSYEQLAAKVAEHNVVSSLRFHAIAPKSECSERWSHLGASYFAVAEASGGQVRDICTESDYDVLIRDIVDEGSRITEPVFPLGKPASTVTEVLVNGTPAPFEVRDGHVLVVDTQIPDSSSQVEVTYSTGRAPAVDHPTAPMPGAEPGKISGHPFRDRPAASPREVPSPVQGTPTPRER